MQPTATPTNSTEAMAQIQQAQAGSKSAGDYLTSANNNAGVGNAQNTVQGLRTSIDNTTKLLNQVAPSVMGRTQGSLVTNAQATRQIGNEQAPISKNLSELGSQYTEAGQNLNTLKSQAAQEAQLGYQSQQDKQSYLQNLYNTMYTKEQNAAQAANTLSQQAEAKRQYEQNFAETQRQNAISQANKVAATPKAGSAAAKTEAISNLHSDITANVADFRNKPDQWTEKTLIPELTKAYPELSQKEIIDAVYQLRKQYE